MENKSHAPRKIFVNADIYRIHSFVKKDVHVTADRLLAGLMGNYLT